MEGFNLKSLRDMLPTEIPKLPSWSNNPDDMNSNNSTGAPSADAPIAVEDAASTAEPMSVEPPAPITSGPKSYLDLINECDNFPYHQQINLYFSHVNTYYALYIADYPETELGYVLPSVAMVFKGLPDWKVDDSDRSLTLTTGATEEERSKAVAVTTSAMRKLGHFKVLEGWRDELYPVYGPNRDLLFSVERAASALFGIVTYGCHMTAYTKSKKAEGEEMKIWVPRRSATKQTYPGLLDNTVAGGIATGESPIDSMIRECQEEASLTEELVRKSIKAVGTVTYFHIRDSRAGGETRLLQPECQYVYDLELAEDVVPNPSDDEVASFEQMTVEQVKEALGNGDFKPNCAVVLIDFFIRHGLITSEDKDYIEICARLHRKFDFPTI
nr:uncharacterized protein CFP56_11726 [Quercus suber]